MMELKFNFRLLLLDDDYYDILRKNERERENSNLSLLYSERMNDGDVSLS